MTERRILFYSPANLNNMDGSTIWVHAVTETLHAGPSNRIVVPLRAAERRTTISAALRRLDRVDVRTPADLGHGRVATLSEAQALDAIEALDREQPFDVILLRSFDLCLAAARRPRLAGRLWSAYILEPERDPESATYLAEMGEIARASRFVVSQSEEMRSLTEALVPAARDRTILLPPAIPAETVARPDPGTIVPRLIYAGKFSPFYPVDRMVAFLVELRRAEPDLTFEVIGDKFGRMPGNPDWQHDLRHSLTRTPGVVWRGAVPREEVEVICAGGGIAMSLWDYRHGSTMNDLVISTKLLDYASVGLPVVLMRTVAQEALLGADYPLFVDDAEEALPLLRRLLADAGLWRVASERTYSSSRRFTYPEVYARMAAFVESDGAGPAAAAALLDRDKLGDAWFGLGLMASDAAAADGALAGAADLLDRLLALDDRYRLSVHVPGGAVAEVRARVASGGRAVDVVSANDEAVGSWLRTVGFLVTDGGPGAPDEATLARIRASGTLPVASSASADDLHEIATGPQRTRPATACDARLA